jgi:hypothetical protein
MFTTLPFSGRVVTPSKRDDVGDVLPAQADDFAVTDKRTPDSAIRAALAIWSRPAQKISARASAKCLSRGGNAAFNTVQSAFTGMREAPTGQVQANDSDCRRCRPNCFADVTNMSCNNGANDVVRRVVVHCAYRFAEPLNPATTRWLRPPEALNSKRAADGAAAVSDSRGGLPDTVGARFADHVLRQRECIRRHRLRTVSQPFTQGGTEVSGACRAGLYQCNPVPSNSYEYLTGFVHSEPLQPFP